MRSGTLNRHLPPIDTSHFSMVPRPDVPRSTFRTQHSHKTTFGSGYLVPIHVDEVLPGDVHQGELVVFARLSTPIFPVMDSLTVETFFFFVPARLVWQNWRKFMGEQANPADSLSYVVPQCQSAVGGFTVCSLFDYFGIPVVGQISGGGTLSVNALPLRAYNLIFNEWFRDENLDNSLTVEVDDGPDGAGLYALQRRRKKHDYFTSCLPWPLKGGVQVNFPFSGLATVKTQVSDVFTGVQPGLRALVAGTGGNPGNVALGVAGNAVGSFSGGPSTVPVYPSNLVADMSTVVGSTINAVRLAVATQQFLEKDARGGTRYTELLRQHFGVHPEDARLQRPEYIGGGCTRMATSAIPQTSATGLTGGSSPQGSLAAAVTAADRHSFSYHATEHGYIIGLVHVGADLTYQQGLHRMWTRQTRYDFYWPVFANLGEQAVRNDEIYCFGGNSGQDQSTFGYQERWAEYRHRPSRISGLFRSTSAGTIDPWHLAQKFTSLPTLAATFISDTPPVARVIAAGAAADNMQVLFDSVFNIRCTRAMPVYSVPGLARF